VTNAPILRSAALTAALAASKVRRMTPPPATQTAPATQKIQTTFEAALTRAQARPVRASAAVPSGNTVDGVPFGDLITAAAKKHGIDPALLAGLVKTESNFNPNAQSYAGAKGLTQLMDATARGLGVTNSFDPQQALEGGAKFLGGLLKQFKGDERLALAAYNAGPGAVQKFGGIPPYEETQRYVPKVLAAAAQFRRISADS
jgi:soluble lytic murein transglycosylase-like protein